MKQRGFAIIRVLVGLAASVGLGWLAIRGLDWSLVGDSLAEVSLPLVVLAVLVFLGGNYLRAARWRVLFVNGEVTINRLFIVQNVGIGLNNVVPVRIASEASQLAILSLRDGVRPSVALATLGMERVIDVVASTVILAVAFVFVPEMENFTLYVWGAVGFAAVCLLVVRLLAWSGSGMGWIGRIPFLMALAGAVRDLERERIRLAISTGMTIVYWLLVGVTAWILAEAVELSISPTTATLAIMGTIFFATAVPAAPAAIGTFEFAVVYVLEIFGVSREAGFGFAVITHAVFFLPPTIMAAVFLPREGIGTVRRLREVVGSRGSERTTSR